MSYKPDFQTYFNGTIPSIIPSELFLGGTLAYWHKNEFLINRFHIETHFIHHFYPRPAVVRLRCQLGSIIMYKNDTN